jgi:hypothetical protein
MLSPAQIEHYQTFGFVILRSYFSPQEVAALLEESTRKLTVEYRHRVFDGTLRHFCCMNDDEMAPTSARLLEDARFFDVAEQLIGGPALPMWNDANRYVDAITGWHPDVPIEPWGMRLPAVKFCHYLQPLRAQSGALRVIPGSHHQPYHDHIKRFLGSQQPPTEAVPAMVCETDPGDVVVFSTPTWHASVGGLPDRRLSTIAYYPCPRTTEDRDGLLQSLREQVPAIRTNNHWQGDVFPRAWIERSASDPARRRVVERIQAFGVFAAVGSDAEAAEAVLASAAQR